ncbi:MAG: hypothetical protein IOD12_08520 [Silvanigrellales bacterium]|nr:hypothetical protein [Silvanigrellales bacterium]
MTLKLLQRFVFGGALVVVSAGCVSRGFNAKESARVAAPADQPISFKIKPTTQCSTGDVGAELNMTHPVTGKPLKVVYKSSDDINYLSKGWESRIPITADFFSSKNLGGYDSSEIKVTVIDVRNVNGKPHYHYFSNGTHMETKQNWSATKFMGASYSIHNIRVQTKGAVGADIRYNGRVLASDLDIIGQESNNNYAGTVKSLGGHKNADQMLENWLLAGKRTPVDGNSTSLDTFGSNWGPPSEPCGASLPPTSVTDLTTGKSTSLNVDNTRLSSSNNISGLTFAEWMKRIAVNERDPDTMPKLWDYTKGAPTAAQARAAKSSLTKRDLEILMYGSAAYSDAEFRSRGLTGSDCARSLGSNYSESGGQPRGGMMWDGLRDWPHNAGGTTTLTKVFGDGWRTLGKGGSGDNDESVIGAMCFPGTSSFKGRELIVYLHFRNTNGRSAPKYKHMHKVAQAVFDVMIPGLRAGAPKDMGTSVARAPVEGEATITNETYLKKVTQQFSDIKDDPSLWCKLPAGSVLAYKDREDGFSGHTKLSLKFADQACPTFPKDDIYVFSGHATFKDK